MTWFGTLCGSKMEGSAGFSSIQSSLQLGKDVCMHGSGVRCVWKEARVAVGGSS